MEALFKVTIIMAHTHHQHDHHHHHAIAFNRAFAFATALNFLFCLVEAIFGILANSLSLLADAAHNLGDVLGLLLSWGAAYLVTKAASDRYSYGLKKTTILAAIINALILVASSAIIAYESIFKLIQPTAVNEYFIIAVAAVGMLINSGTALLFIQKESIDLNIKAAFLHLAYDALISFSVVIGGFIILGTGWLRIDPLLGLLIVAIVLAGTWRLLRDSINLILDAVPQQIDYHAVKKFLSELPGVTAVHDLHIWGLSTHEIALTAHLVIPEKILQDNDYHVINQQLKHLFHIEHITLQIEKGNSDDCKQALFC